jgi:hypothetical protein
MAGSNASGAKPGCAKYARLKSAKPNRPKKELDSLFKGIRDLKQNGKKLERKIGRLQRRVVGASSSKKPGRKGAD